MACLAKIFQHTPLLHRVWLFSKRNLFQNIVGLIPPGNWFFVKFPHSSEKEISSFGSRLLGFFYYVEIITFKTALNKAKYLRNQIQFQNYLIKYSSVDNDTYNREIRQIIEILCLKWDNFLPMSVLHSHPSFWIHCRILH